MTLARRECDNKMNMNYYQSEELLSVSIKDFFTDRHGYANEQAFYHYLKTNKDMLNDIPYRLICINVDLRKANAQSIAFGDYVLNKLIMTLEDYSVFRIQGEKFNVIVKDSDLPTALSILEKPNENYDIYVGVAPSRLMYNDISDVAKIIREGVRLMFENKSRSKDKDNAIIGNKGRTPKALRETKLTKFRNTMWYSTIKIRITEPTYKELTVFVFPTEFKQALQSIPTIAIIYDNLDYRVLYSNDIHFGTDGLLFTLNTRFDREGHLNTAIFNTGTGKCEFDIDTSEGICIPHYFGKKISATKEIYPFRKNVQGYCDYVSLDNGVVELNKEGILKTANGELYGVTMDSKCINLIPLHTERSLEKAINEERNMEQ